MTTEYYKHGVNLTDGQKRNIESTYKKNSSVSIRLSNKNLEGNDMLAITTTQLNKIRNAKNGVQLNLSASQLRYMEKTGGFLPLIPLIAGLLAGVGGITGGVASAVSVAKSIAEQKRHNEAIEKVPIIGNLLGPLLQKIGLGNKEINKIIEGKCICKDGFRLKQIGSGLYFEHKGSGSFLRPG